MNKNILLIIFLFCGILSFLSYSAEWTVMVYLDGDNDLESSAISDFNEMEIVGSDSNVNITVLFDRISGYDSSNGNWTDTRMGLVQKDNDTNSIGTTLTSMGELNMGDPQTLINFVNWSINNYPAKYYMLILWDHGNGWYLRSAGIIKEIKNLQSLYSKTGKSGVLQQINILQNQIQKSTDFKSICVDQTSGDRLNLKEIRDALASTGVKLDILAYDACLMGMMEVAYEQKDNALIHIGSENTIPLNGFPYDTILGDLSGQPAMTPRQLSSLITYRYGESYLGTQTLSAIDLTKIEDVNAAINNFAATCISLNNQWNALEEVKFATPTIYGYDPTYYDLKSFMLKAAEVIQDTTLKQSAENVAAKIDAAVIANHTSTIPYGTGLSIYIVGMGYKVNSEYNSNNLLFCGANNWDEMLYIWTGYSPLDDDFEENDSIDKATTVSLGLYENLKCFDKDWYIIYIQKPGEYLLSVNHIATNGDLDTKLYRKNSETGVLTFIDSGITYSNTEALLCPAYPGDILYLEVYQYGNNIYSLLISENKLSTDTLTEFLPFKWEDIQTSGTPILMGDDSSASVNIGFDFPFYENIFPIVKVSSNGYMTFDTIGGEIFDNQAFPVTMPPKGIIAPFWCDLSPDYDNGVFYQLIKSDSPEETKFIVQWNDVLHYESSPSGISGITFQTVLHKNGMIDFIYKDVFFKENDKYNSGGVASVGIANYEGTKGYLYSLYGKKLSDNMFLRWRFNAEKSGSNIWLLE